MTSYSTMIEVKDPLHVVEDAAVAYAIVHPGARVLLERLAEDWLTVRVQCEAVSLLQAAEHVAHLVEFGFEGELVACYTMTTAEFERRVPRSERGIAVGRRVPVPA